MNFLGQSCRCQSGAIFVIEGDRQWSYASADREIARISHILDSLGITANTRVGVLLPNQALTIFVYLALAYLGAIAICLNTRLSDREVQDLLMDSQAVFLISSKPMATPGFCNLVPLNLLAEIDEYREVPSAFNWERLQGIFYTSGTTGKPKAVPLTYLNHWHSAIAVNNFLAVKPQNWLLCLPLYHMGGMAIVWRSLLVGGSITLLPQFTPEAVIKLVAKGLVNLISLVPTMLKRILADVNFLASLSSWQSMEAIFLGGASADQELLEQCLTFCLPIFITYGMTETASQITILELQKYPDKIDSVGLVLAHAEVKIIPANDQVGEIAVKSPAAIAGYEGMGRTQVTEDGYFLTGDLGYFDQENFLHVVNRRTDLIISGGENIYPAEIEQLLLQHPLIEEVCVVAKSDPEWGEVPAVVVTTPQLSLSTIQEFCLEHNLARYKFPRFLLYLPQLPITSAGKGDRGLLKKLVADL